MKKFDGKLLVVTGGASGIGKATALLLAENGADVAVVDLNKEAAEKACEEIRALGKEAKAYGCDVANYDMVAVSYTHLTNNPATMLRRRHCP